MKLFGCNHNYEIYYNDNVLYQHCTKCGDVITAPCAHKWEEVERFEVKGWMPNYNGETLTRVYSLRCSKCGDMRNHRVYV